MEHLIKFGLRERPVPDGQVVNHSPIEVGRAGAAPGQTGRVPAAAKGTRRTPVRQAKVRLACGGQVDAPAARGRAAGPGAPRHHHRPQVQLPQAHQGAARLAVQQPCAGEVDRPTQPQQSTLPHQPHARDVARRSLQAGPPQLGGVETAPAAGRPPVDLDRLPQLRARHHGPGNERHAGHGGRRDGASAEVRGRSSLAMGWPPHAESGQPFRPASVGGYHTNGILM